jgi:hypothetical protein
MRGNHDGAEHRERAEVLTTGRAGDVTAAPLLGRLVARRRGRAS